MDKDFIRYENEKPCHVDNINISNHFSPYADEYRDGHTCLIVVVDNKTMANPCGRDARRTRCKPRNNKSTKISTLSASQQNGRRSPQRDHFCRYIIIHTKPRIVQTNLTSTLSVPRPPYLTGELTLMLIMGFNLESFMTC